MLRESGSDATSRQDSDDNHRTVQVVRRDLTVRSEVTGDIGFGSPGPLPISAEGTVTWLPQSGSELGRGSVIMRVDERPIALLIGDVPAFRAMYDTAADGLEPGAPIAPTGEDSSASAPPSTPPPAGEAEPMVGNDVEQLERNLALLGYTGFEVDGTFTSATAASVREWQRDLDLAPTGRVERGDVVFWPAPIRVATDASALGTQAVAAAVQQTPTEKLVSATATADELGWAKPETRVRVTFANQRSMRGTVISVRPTGPGEEGDGSMSLRVRLAHPDRAPRSGPVTISYVEQQRRGVLAVPVLALVALAEGGYGLQLDDAAGSFVPVTPGLYADGEVEVTGAIEAGTQIRVPR